MWCLYEPVVSQHALVNCVIFLKLYFCNLIAKRWFQYVPNDEAAQFGSVKSVTKTRALRNKLCKNPDNSVSLPPVDSHTKGQKAIPKSTQILVYFVFFWCSPFFVMERMCCAAELMFDRANGHTTLTSPARSSPCSPIPFITKSMHPLVRCGFFATGRPTHLVNTANSSLITSCLNIAPPPCLQVNRCTPNLSIWDPHMHSDGREVESSRPKYNRSAGKNRSLSESSHLKGIAFSQSSTLGVESAINFALSVRDDSPKNSNTCSLCVTSAILCCSLIVSSLVRLVVLVPREVITS